MTNNLRTNEMQRENTRSTFYNLQSTKISGKLLAFPVIMEMLDFCYSETILIIFLLNYAL